MFKIYTDRMPNSEGATEAKKWVVGGSFLYVDITLFS